MKIFGFFLLISFCFGSLLSKTETVLYSSGLKFQYDSPSRESLPWWKHGGGNLHKKLQNLNSLYPSCLSSPDFSSFPRKLAPVFPPGQAFARAPSSEEKQNNEMKNSNLIHTIDVPPGKTFYQLAGELKEKQIISSEKLFKALILLYGRPALRQGEYEISSDRSVWEIFNHFKEGKVRVFKVSFPEGFNHYEMAETLKNHNYSETEQFLNLVWNKNFTKKLIKQDLESLEGYLFPDTYQLTKYLPAEDLITSMTQKFAKIYQEISQSPLEVNLSRHQVVTLASLVEKETGQAKERPLIAGVFFNRLKKKMKLQSDPTILYSLYLIRGFDIEKNIRKADILFNSPYNTYVVKGLPPNPIANPGKESLQAVFKPEKSDYFYFVSRNDGSHKFSKTYKEHEKAVYEYQIKKK
ncbi:MAG: endolytic transglycosylase MltG [Oligoflexia bacterium]|nr:endolytic transglycosylase MltG [Oligoflexia bacterium]